MRQNFGLFVPSLSDETKSTFTFNWQKHDYIGCRNRLYYTMQLNMDARNHFAMRARIEMHQGNYQEALRFLSMALNQIPPFLGKVAAPLLADRAECFWQLGHAGKAVQEMMNARDAGLPAYGENSEVAFVFLLYQRCFFFDWALDWALSTEEFRFLEPSVFRNSRKFEPKLTFLQQSNTVISFF